MSTVNKEEEAIKKIFGGKWGQTDTWQGALAGSLGSAGGSLANTLLGQGRTDNIGGKIGSGISNIGSAVGSALSAVDPRLGGAVSLASGLLGGGITALVGADFNEEAIANIENQNKRMSNTLVASGSNSDIMSQWANQEWGDNFTKSDLGKEGWLSNAVTDKYNTLQKEQQAAQNRVLASYDNAIENTNKQSALNMLANYSALGGPIHIKPSKRGTFTAAASRHNMGVQEFARKVLANKDKYSTAMVKKANFARNSSGWKHAEGGFLTHGGIFDNGLIYINNGDSHESNPYEGIQMGVDSKGIPNLVEEGEVIWNDYVFSNRLNVPNAIRTKYKLRGTKELPFSDAAIQLAKESEERPNDPISKRGLQANMLKLATAQEAIREERHNNEANIFAQGGAMGQDSPPKVKIFNNGRVGVLITGEELLKRGITTVEKAKNAGIPVFYRKGKKGKEGKIIGAYLAGEPITSKDDYAVDKGSVYVYVTDKGNTLRQAMKTLFFDEESAAPKKESLNTQEQKPTTESKDSTLTKNNNPTDESTGKEGDTTLTTEQKGTPKDTEVKRDSDTDSKSASEKKELATVDMGDETEVDDSGVVNLPEAAFTLFRDYPDTNYLDEPFYVRTKPEKIEREYKNIKIGDGVEDEVSVTDILKEASKLYSPKEAETIDRPVILHNPQEMLGIPYKKVENNLPKTIDMIDTTSLKDDDPFDLSFLRYLEALGPLTGIVSNLRSPDYSRANRLEEAAAKLSAAPVVSYTPISTRLGYDPMDRNYLANRLAAEAGATRNAILNSTNPSRNAALLAADYNAQNLSGDAYRKADEYNLAQRQAVAQFNRGTEQANAELGLKASIANAEMAQKASQLGFAGLSNAIDMKNKIDNLKASSLATNLSNLFTSLGNIGKEETYKKWIKENPEYAKYFRGK